MIRFRACLTTAGITRMLPIRFIEKARCRTRIMRRIIRRRVPRTSRSTGRRMSLSRVSTDTTRERPTSIWISKACIRGATHRTDRIRIHITRDRLCRATLLT
eukprot:32594_5